MKETTGTALFAEIVIQSMCLGTMVCASNAVTAGLTSPAIDAAVHHSRRIPDQIMISETLEARLG